MSDPSGPGHRALDAESILAALNTHHVVSVVGGYAAELHGSARPTVDIDVVPATDAENLGRLAAALRDLSARIRTASDPEGLPFSTSGTTGYDDLVRDASDLDVLPLCGARLLRPSHL